MADSNLRPVAPAPEGGRPPQRAHLPMHSDQVNEILPALLAAHAAFPEIERTRTVKVKSEKGQYEFKYAPLDTIAKAIGPCLTEHKLVITQTPVRYPDGDFMRTTLWHAPSGQFLASEVELQVPRGGGAAAYGGSLTYARRHGESGLLNITTETDNDAPPDGSRKPKPQGGNHRADGDSEAKVTPVQLRSIRQAIIASGRKEPEVVAHFEDRYGLEGKLENLPASSFDRVLTQLKKPPATPRRGNDHHPEE